MKTLLIFILYIFFSCNLIAQNLIIDGSFENVECPDNPINSFDSNETWYTTGADAYYIDFSCPFDPEASMAIEALKPFISYGGSAHFSLESLLSGSGYLISEGLATELQEPMISGDFYYFDMAYMNYEGVLTSDYENMNCDPLIDRAMHVIVGEDPLEITSEVTATTQGLLITDLESNGRKILSTNRAFESGFSFNQWYTYWNCFQAENNDSHIGVVGDFKFAGSTNSCYDSLGRGFVYTSGHALDEVRLYRIPNRLDSTFVICQESEVELDLVELFSEPYAEKATFEWRDGINGPIRKLSKIGTYEAMMILPCVSVPISITIEELKCKADVYVANIFTPNNDGKNDILLPKLYSDLVFDNYEFTVYDRWGSIVFETNDINIGWNGDAKNEVVVSGIYSWKIEYTFLDSEEKFIEVGEVLRM